MLNELGISLWCAGMFFYILSEVLQDHGDRYFKNKANMCIEDRQTLPWSTLPDVFNYYRQRADRMLELRLSNLNAILFLKMFGIVIMLVGVFIL